MGLFIIGTKEILAHFHLSLEQRWNPLFGVPFFSPRQSLLVVQRQLHNATKLPRIHSFRSSKWSTSQQKLLFSAIKRPITTTWFNWSAVTAITTSLIWGKKAHQETQLFPCHWSSPVSNLQSEDTMSWPCIPVELPLDHQQLKNKWQQPIGHASNHKKHTSKYQLYPCCPNSDPI